MDTSLPQILETLQPFRGAPRPGANPLACPNPKYCPHGSIKVAYKHPNVIRLLCPVTGKLGQPLKSDDFYLQHRRERCLDSHSPAIPVLRALLSRGWWDRYRAYLLSPEWAVRREAVIVRCQGICEDCHTESVAHVHHKTYKRLGEERPEDLQGLCVLCHQRHHPEKFYGP